MIRIFHRYVSPLVCLIAALVFSPSFVTAQDVDKSKIVGTWNATGESDRGERSSVWTIKREGDGYTGHYKSEESDETRELSNISFDGSELRFEIEIEAQGQQLLIEVVSKLTGNKAEGNWMASSDGNELASGTVTAVKKVVAKFGGKWSTVATLPDGEELEGNLVLKGKNKELSGAVDAHGEETKIDEIEVDGQTIRMELQLDVEGEKRDLVIEADLKSEKSLEGKWILLNDDGDEEVSGDWVATRAKPAKPAKPAKKDDTVVLFDGSSLDNFRGYSEEAIGSGWKIVDGALHLDGTKKTGDIVTKKQYGDFELKFEWKISEGGNSGVMYRVSLGDKKPYLTGPEYQVLDDSKHKDGKFESRTSGSLYALYVPENKKLKPVGQWNTSKIVLKGNNVEHWLNGQAVVLAEIGSDDWNEKVEASKFKKWEKFAKNKNGHICFQDHGNKVWYRNITIKPLD